LSIIIQETLQLDKPRFFESDFTNIMNQKLNSEGFLNGLVRLIKNEMRKKNSEEKQNSKNMLTILNKIKELKDIKVKLVERIQSSFFDSRTQKDITKQSTGSYCFIDSKSNSFYISKEIPGYLDLHTLCSQEMNKFLQYPLQDCSLIPILLKCKEDEINVVLDSFNISNFIGDDISTMNRKLGKPLFKSDEQFFKKLTKETKLNLGELIAFSKDEKLLYGRIIEKMQKKYKISIGTSKDSVISLEWKDIYKFSEDHEEIVVIEKVGNEGKVSLMEKLQSNLICPITREIFMDPVIASDGFTYEREAITGWLGVNKNSPITRALLTETLIPNKHIKMIISEIIDDEK
jgi:hypothetical protein